MCTKCMDCRDFFSTSRLFGAISGQNLDMELNELTEKIIGAGHKVLFALKLGLYEKLYERALVIELTKLGLRSESQRPF